MQKEDYMRLALDLAETAAENDEVPVGAVVVDAQTSEILATAYNQSAHNGDATSHAEILAIQRACKKLDIGALHHVCGRYFFFSYCESLFRRCR